MHTRRLFAAVLALAGAPWPCVAATYRVSPRGDDADQGASWADAFQTISRGVQALGPGDTLVVGPGIYREQVRIETSGSRDKPITVRAQTPGRAELVGSVRLTEWAPVRGREQVFWARLGQPTYLVYEKDTDVEYLEVANLHTLERTPGAFLYSPHEQAIYVHPSDDMGMAHHVVDACVLDYGLASLTTKRFQDHSPRRVGLVIEGFVVRGYNTCGIFIHNADDCAVRRCTVHHCRRGIFTFSAFRSQITDCRAFACADRFNREQGNIGMMSYSFECLLARNIVHSTRQHGIRFYGGFYGCVMRDNLAYGCQIGAHVKGRVYDHTMATRYARFSDRGKPSLDPNAEMAFTGNVAHEIVGTGLLPHYCRYERCVGVKVQSGRSTTRKLNIELPAEPGPQDRFAAPEWHDLRLQSDSPHRRPGMDGLDVFPHSGPVFFVRPDGDDTNAGTSVAAAWKTLRHAAVRLAPGHTLYLLPGAYAEPIVLKGLKGAATATIVRARTKGEAAIDLGGKHASAVEVVDCGKVRIEGLRLRGAATQGVLVRNSTHVQLRENEVCDHAGDGVRVEGESRHVRVVSNTIVFNAGAGVSASHDAADAWIVGNIVRDNGVQVGFPTGLPPGVYCDLNDVGGAGLLGCAVGKLATSLDLWRQITGLDSRSVDLPPGFVDADARDLRLTRTSLCRGRGHLGRPIGSGRVAPPAAEEVAFTNVRVVDVTATTADLAWSTRGGKATEVLAYGTDPDKLDTTVLRDTGHYYGIHHLRTLTGLRPGTRYFVRVGSRRLLDGPQPYHYFRYAWPERTPAGEEEYYKTLRKEDRLDGRLVSFTTRTRDAAAPRTFHVSTTGDDASPGTEAQPWRTIARACDMAGPGERVVVHEGTYHECIRPIRSGLPGRPIAFEAARGERVEINGARELIPHGVDLHNRRCIVVRGFVFFGQSEVGPNHSGFGQVRAVECEDVRVEQCLFDGRMNYVNPVFVYRSRDVTVHNNIFVSHHNGMIVHDNAGTIAITRNTFLGVTIHKIYAPRNARVVARGNLFGENLFPKKKKQYKVVLMSNHEVDMDYNCFYFDPKNAERRAIDIAIPGIDLAAVTALPEQQASTAKPQRYGIRGTLDVWQQQLGRGRHSVIADPKWAGPAAVADARSRVRGWPSRFFEYRPLRREEFRLADDSPCRGAGPNGVDMGADYAY